MKKLILTILIGSLFFPLFACAGMTNLTLEWDAITDPGVVQVRIYQRDHPGGVYDYNNPAGVVPTPATEMTLTNIPNGSYAWVARAIDGDALESIDSNEITDTFAVPPKTIQNLRKKFSIPSP